MSAKAKRLIKKVISYSGIFFFILAAGMLWWQLRNYSLSDIAHAILDIPFVNLAMACLACMLGYLALSLYDLLALNYVGGRVSWWKWMLAGMLGFAISNNAGHAVVSGGAVRYRLYTRWRFRPNEIVRMVTFSGFTYLIACFFLSDLGWILTPAHAFEGQNASQWTTNLVAFISFIGLLIYFGLCHFYKKTLTIHDVPFKMPSVKMALAQVIIGGCDIVLAAFVLYFCLIEFVHIPFDVFIGVFIIAQVLGVFSQVPGGLGVFETLFLAILPNDTNTAYLFGALIAYRIIYYVLPLLVSGIVLVAYETYRARRFRQIKTADE